MNEKRRIKYLFIEPIANNKFIKSLDSETKYTN